jgi:hypothetical protein
MDCPECGGRLADYRLGDRAAVGCEDCGYVGIDAEHRGTPVERESWTEAIERFRRQHAPEPTDADGGDAEPDDGPVGDGTRGTASGEGDPANGEAVTGTPTDDE